MEQTSHHHAVHQAMVTLAVEKRGMTTAWKAEGVRPRPALIAIALAAFALGVLIGWDVLVAGAIAAVVIWALPWAAITALELYMIRMGGSSSSTDTGAPQSTSTISESVQFDSARALSRGPEPTADPAEPVEGEAVGVDQLEQQERRPTHA